MSVTDWSLHSSSYSAQNSVKRFYNIPISLISEYKMHTWNVLKQKNANNTNFKNKISYKISTEE